MVTDKIVVLNTCSTAGEAQKVARSLVEMRLAACVNIVSPVQSIYRWQGAVEESSEFLLIIKTRRELLSGVQEELRRLHSYQIPEVLALSVVDGYSDYLDWIDKETTR